MLKVLLGKNIIDKPVYWEIDKEKNPHILVLGTSGSGKTETLKAIIHDLNRAKVPSMIIDFHSEFKGVGKNIINMRQIGMNPLEFSQNETPEAIVYEVSAIMKKIFGLGEIQESIVRQAIKNSYLNLGIDLRKEGPSEKCPTFSDVKKEIYKIENPVNKRNIDSLMSRIEPLFELEIFDSSTQITFSELVDDTTVVDLKNFPTETIKSVIAEFFLSKLSNYIYSLEKKKDINLYIVVDEAHRLMYEGSPLDRFLRESRKYGVGVILASQRPTDFNETVLANAGVLLSFQCTLEKDAAFVARQLGIDSNKIRNLVDPGVGYVKFSRGEKAERVRITRLQDRLTDQDRKEMKIPPKEISTPLEKREYSKKPIQEDLEKIMGKSDARKEPIYDERARKMETVDVDEEEAKPDKKKLLKELEKEDEEEHWHHREEKKKESHGDEYDVEEEHPQKHKYRKEGFGFGAVSQVFFFEGEKFNSRSALRILAISAFFILGFWQLLAGEVLSILFFSLGILLTPFVAEALTFEKSYLISDVIRIIIAIGLVYLFVFY